MTETYILCYEVLIPTFIASVYGFTVIMRRHKGLYFSMGVLAVFCMFIGQLAYFFALYTGNQSYTQFHIGTLGSVGSCLFFLTANMGPVNMLADIDDEKRRKCNALAYIGPAVLAVIFTACTAVMYNKGIDSGIAVTAMLTAITMPPMYFITKAAIIPDVKDGFYDCMRPYNMAVTGLMILFTLERSARSIWSDSYAALILSYVFYGVLGLCAPSVMFLLERGATRWKNI